MNIFVAKAEQDVKFLKNAQGMTVGGAITLPSGAVIPKPAPGKVWTVRANTVVEVSPEPTAEEQTVTDLPTYEERAARLKTWTFEELSRVMIEGRNKVLCKTLQRLLTEDAEFHERFLRYAEERIEKN